MPLDSVDLGYLIESLPDGIALHDRNGLLYVNPALAEMLGHERSQILGRPLLAFVNPRDRPCLARSILGLLEDGRAQGPQQGCVRRAGGVESLWFWGKQVVCEPVEIVLLVIRDRDPLRTTKPPGQGTGLGLPLARDLVEEQGGVLEVESESGVGTVARISLPIASAARRFPPLEQ